MHFLSLIHLVLRAASCCILSKPWALDDALVINGASGLVQQYFTDATPRVHGAFVS
jgi:hypothetical protein